MSRRFVSLSDFFSGSSALAEEYDTCIRDQCTPVKSLVTRLNVVAFYSNCNNPTAFGDFAQCGALAYDVQKKCALPVLLTSRSQDVHRFDSLYRSPNATQHQIFGSPLIVSGVKQLDTNRYNIVAYIEVAWCKPNDRDYVEKVMMRDGGRAAFVGTANYEPLFSQPNHCYPDLFTSGRAKSFLVGFGSDRDGVTFSPFSSIASQVQAEELAMSVFPEKLITENPGHGLVYVTQTQDMQNDIAYVGGYMRHFVTQTGKNLVVALGSIDVIGYAAQKLCQAHDKPVVLIDYIERKSALFRKGKQPKIIKGILPINPTQTGMIYIITAKSVPNLQLRRLIVNANAFVGFTGVSSTIEAFGEGKVVYYQNMPNNVEFVKSFMMALIAASRLENGGHADQNMIKLANLLLWREKPLSDEHMTSLDGYLRGGELCQRLAQTSKQIVRDASYSLGDRLLTWLRIPVVRSESAASSSSSTLSFEA